MWALHPLQPQEQLDQPEEHEAKVKEKFEVQNNLRKSKKGP